MGRRISLVLVMGFVLVMMVVGGVSAQSVTACEPNNCGVSCPQSGPFNAAEDPITEWHYKCGSCDFQYCSIPTIDSGEPSYTATIYEDASPTCETSATSTISNIKKP